MKKAIIVIPTYNESKNVGPVTEKLQEVFKKIKNWKMEILIVDDTSPDKTYDVVKELQKKQKNLHLVINKKKAGLGGAYLRGFKEAYGPLGADVAFEFDADLSHDPTKIPQFLKMIDEGYDMVLGSRYIKGGGIPDDWGIDRKFMSVVGNLVIMTVLTDFRIRDWTGGYRAITKEVYEDVHKNLTSERFSGYTFQIGSLHQAVRKGYKVGEVPFQFVDRTEGESKLGGEYVKNTLIYIFKVRLEEIMKSRFFKFLFVGGLGTIIQLVSLSILRALLPDFNFLFLTKFLTATLIAIELAIASNFVLNNLWTFADKKLDPKKIPNKFLQFNLASMGSVIIQFIVNLLGENLIGLKPLFKLPVINFMIDTGLIFAMTGIIIGLFWNFFAYNKFIWNSKKKK
ncbi:MAG: glycosyltransferase family 2 protein [Candidatus Pacebacteria bacterium]|nr:glycosyltransferase family 2 protein [Candidatus Paceibacterota bacterium]